MLGITLIELASALKEASLAVAAAASFWAIWLGISSRRTGQDTSAVLRRQIIPLLLPLFVTGAVAAFFFWTFAGQLIEADAHEGVTLFPTDAEISATAPAAAVGFAGLALAVLSVIWARRNRPEYFFNNAERIYLFPFIISAFLVSFPAWRGQWDSSQWFYFGHSFHAIFTLGTVITLDYLLFRVKSLEIRRVFYGYLIPISAVIWVGLGMDFASSFLVLDEALELTPKFFFLQTLIGILLINGAFLAGPVANKMIMATRGMRLTRGWATAASVSGALSIVSWISVKFTDFFRGLTPSYPELIGLYLMAVAGAVVISVSLRDGEFRELM